MRRWYFFDELFLFFLGYLNACFFYPSSVLLLFAPQEHYYLLRALSSECPLPSVVATSYLVLIILYHQCTPGGLGATLRNIVNVG